MTVNELIKHLQQLNAGDKLFYVELDSSFKYLRRRTSDFTLKEDDNFIIIDL